MTTDVSETYIAAMEELAAMGPDYRANVPAGTVLGEEGFGDGGMVRHRKRQSMVRMGGQALPERVRIWNVHNGSMSVVPPTIAQKRLMEGTKQFPGQGNFTLRDPGFPKPEPISETCEVCDKKRAEAGNPPRPFYDVLQYEAHMELMHPRWWSTHLRREQQSERLEDRAAMRDMIREIVGALRPEVLGDEDTSEIEDQITGEVIRRTRRRRAR